MSCSNNLPNVKEILKSKKHSIGSWMQIANTSVAELMGKAGYDWVAIDMEHGSFSCQQLPDLFRALELGGTSPFVRVAYNNLVYIKDALDSGARGIIIPMVENKEQVENAVSACLYPPDGTRGVGYSRANLFGKEFDSYVSYINRAVTIIAQIEHINAVTNIDEILSNKHLDGIMVGPYDLSASMGVTGQFTNPKFLNTLKEIKNAAQKHSVPMGLHIVNPDKKELTDRVAEGYQFIAYGIDSVFLNNSIKQPLKDEF